MFKICNQGLSRNIKIKRWRFTSIDNVKWSCTCQSMETCIIRIFCPRYKGVPFRWLFLSKATQVSFKILVHHFCLTISLGMMVLIFNWVLHNLKSSCQKLLIKITSQLETMERGMPCRCTISLQKCSATILAVKGWASGINCAYLLRRSTTTRTVSKWEEGGSPTMKSREISFQTQSGIGNSWSRPAGDKASYLCCWHCKQFWTWCLMSCLILG